MAEKILMLALSPTMDKGHIAEWLKQEGDTVASGDLLCEVETDKATMDYESSVSGVLLKIVAPAGSEAAIGDLIAIIGEAGEDISALLEDKAAAALVQAATPEKVVQDKPVEAEAQSEVRAEDEPASSDAYQKASPLARKLAEKNGLNLADIKGSGPQGRVIKADIDQMMAQSGLESKTEAKADVAQAAYAPAAQEDLLIPVSRMRSIIAKRLAESKFSAPHYYLKISVEMDGLLASLKQLNKKSEAKISLNAFLTKIVAEVLKKHPRVNASWQGDTILQFGHVDIGTAVALKDGLITPVVRNCGNKGILQIDTELKQLIDKARSNALQPEEYAGATFTISSLGSLGIEEFSAIINPPGSAILAVGAIKKKAVVLEDESIVVRSMMKLSLSCDHRVIDGAVAAAFLTDLKETLESPLRALF